MNFVDSVGAAARAASPPDPRSASKWVIVALLITLSLRAQVTVNTIAGGQIRSGVPAQDVSLSGVIGLAWDSAGNLIFCDRSANVIRRIRPDGILETIAGSGTTGSSGDGGPALAASLNSPQTPRIHAGSTYFADWYNYRIRRIDSNGVITTIAGDGIPRRNGMDLEGPALARSINAISDLAIDDTGNVYFTEVDSNLIRRVTTAGNVEIFAGTPHPDCPSCSDGDGGPARAARFVAPSFLAIDGAGNLYVTDGPRIRRITPDGIIEHFAGYGQTTGTAPDDEGKPALDTYFYSISAMAADAAGNVYIEQGGVFLSRGSIGPRIRRIDTNGNLTTLAGGGSSTTTPDGPALPSSISPYGLAVDSKGNVVYAESTNSGFARLIREVTAQSTLKTLAGGSPKPAPDGTPAASAWLLNPTVVAFNHTGDLYIAEADVCLIRKIGADGKLATVAGTGTCAQTFLLRPSTTQDLPPVAGMAFDSQNRLYVVDGSSNVYGIAADGKVTVANFPPVLGPGVQIAIDAKDRVYLLAMFSLLRILPDGTRQTIVGPPSQPGVPPPGFGPTSLTSLGADPAGNVYFTGTYLGSQSYSVFRVNDDGTYTSVIGASANLILGFPIPLNVDAAGTVWLGNSFINPSGRWAIGRPDPGYSGDGGLAQSARFNGTASALAPNGDLYVLDTGRVRRITGLHRTPAPSVAAGGIVNAISYSGGPIARGELISIFGANFGATTLQVNSPENNRIPWVLGRTKILFDGFAGAITAVTPNQINVFVPTFVSPGKNTSVVVQVDDAVSAPVAMPVASAAPGMAPAVLNQDGSINSPANPAPRGSVVSLFGTGEGSISPRLTWGDFNISTPFATIDAPVAVTIAGQLADVLYAGEAPLQPAGVFQINARIPAAATGNATVSVSIGGIAAPPIPVAVR